MDYYFIGQQIRKYRKAQGLSQEQLAEKVGISVTHMSHIETANTKLSLPVFVDIATALEVCTDDLLHETPTTRHTSLNSLHETLDACSPWQLSVLTDLLRSAKRTLDKYSPS